MSEENTKQSKENKETAVVPVKESETTAEKVEVFEGITKEFKKLPKENKKKLLFGFLALLIPMAVYSAFGMGILIKDKMDRLDEYYSTEITPEQQAIKDKLDSSSYENNPGNSDVFYSEVTVGLELYNINGIDNGKGSFEIEVVLWFDFERTQYENMVVNKYNLEKGSTVYADFASMKLADPTLAEKLFQDHLPGRDNNFDLGGRGAFHMGWPKPLTNEDEYYNYTNPVTGNVEERIYQPRRVLATIIKKFDSPRYPLDSLQFKFYFRPAYDARFMRYRIATPNNPADNPNLYSRLTSLYDIDGEYGLLHKDPKWFTTDIFYYESGTTNPVLPFSSKIQTEFMTSIVVNRENLSIFFQVFITLFAIIIWTFIALYDGAFNNEFKISTLGTSMFGIISAILIGVNLISEPIAFSLVNIVNIFGLAMVLLSTVIFMIARKKREKGDEHHVRQNKIFVRLMFWSMLTMALVVMIVTPVAIFIW